MIGSKKQGQVSPTGEGEAPLGLAFIGTPVFCTIWTLCGVPALSLPILALARLHADGRAAGPRPGLRRRLAAAGALVVTNRPR
jgi:hypothetical protein